MYDAWIDFGLDIHIWDCCAYRA